MNEKGFAAAALYFPGYAQYDEEDSSDISTVSIAAYELLGYLLGNCASVDQAAGLLDKVRIVGKPAGRFYPHVKSPSVTLQTTVFHRLKLSMGGSLCHRQYLPSSSFARSAEISDTGGIHLLPAQR